MTDISVPVLRGIMHVTQARMARMLGVSQRTIIRWERGQSAPSPLAARRIRQLADSLPSPDRALVENHES